MMTRTKQTSVFERLTELTVEEKALIRAAKLAELLPTEGHAMLLHLASRMVLTQPTQIRVGP